MDLKCLNNVCYQKNVSYTHKTKSKINLIEVIDALNALTSVFLLQVFVGQHARAGLRQQSLTAVAEQQDDNNHNATAFGPRPAGAAFPRLSCGQFLRATITRHQYACGRRAQSGHHPSRSSCPSRPASFLLHSCRRGSFAVACLDAL